MANKTNYLNHEKLNSTRVKAFTLVELIMVVVLLSVITITVAPRFFDNHTREFRVLANHIGASVKYAQKLAVASGCLTEFQITNYKYSIKQDANCFNANAPAYNQDVWDPEELEEGFEHSYDRNDFSLSKSSTPLIFNAKGELHTYQQLLPGRIISIRLASNPSSSNGISTTLYANVYIDRFYIENRF